MFRTREVDLVKRNVHGAVPDCGPDPDPAPAPDFKNANSYSGDRTFGHDGRTLLGLTDGLISRQQDSIALGHSASPREAGRLVRVDEASSTRQLCARGF
ncbi:MAG: hypothetical protein EOP05_23575 [Proteobacteria bacterium]|nr:MAG: hypothetical protein EOP05_23575 [Pseudomonadota bacterium]